MPKLIDLILNKIEELGPRKAAEFFNEKPATISRWVSRAARPSCDAAQLVLDEIGQSAGTPTPAADESGARLLAANRILEQAGADGNWDATEYHFGMFNGIELALATVEGREVNYRKAPELWADGTPSKKASGANYNPNDFKASNISILVPANRALALTSVVSLLGSWKAAMPLELQELLPSLHAQKDTMIARARNILAERFLAGSAEWSFWHDADMIAPNGNPKWFLSKNRGAARFGSEVCGKTAIRALTSHAGRGIVSAIYVARDGSGRIVAHCGMNANGGQDEIEIGKGDPIQQPWVGFGCVAVHRKVFLDIAEKCADVAAPAPGEPRGFFSPIDGLECSEDIAFCKRASDAGHAAFLDPTIICGHIGETSFLP